VTVWIDNWIYWTLKYTQLITTNNCSTIAESHSAVHYSTHLSLFSLLCLHKSSGSGFQQQTFLFLWVWTVPVLSYQLLTATATRTELQQSLNSLTHQPTHSTPPHQLPGWRPSHTSLLLFSLPTQDSSSQTVRVRVTLWLAVYRQSFCLGDEPLETHNQNIYFPTEHLWL
jgi:hypothetical protein